MEFCLPDAQGIAANTVPAVNTRRSSSAAILEADFIDAELDYVVRSIVACDLDHFGVSCAGRATLGPCDPQSSCRCEDNLPPRPRALLPEETQIRNRSVPVLNLVFETYWSA